MEPPAPKEKIALFWSGGKESLLALCALLKHEDFLVTALLTTVNYNGKVPLHGITTKLLQQQVMSLGLELKMVAMPNEPTFEELEKALKKILQQFKQEGINHVAFGDMNNMKARAYHERLLASFGMKAVFPLWDKNQRELMNAFVDLGFKAIVTSVNPRILDRQFTGREINGMFFDDLPKNVSPCGENGEFRTFVYNGPVFSQPIGFKKSVVTLRDNAYFCDLTEVVE